MGKCAALNCTSQPTIKATTDIAGPGVLYAYLVSAILAIAAIVYGYLSDSLPDWYLNETDRMVIASFNASLPSAKNMARLRSLYGRVKNIFRAGKQSKPHQKLTKKQREEVLKRFVLTLSDQQLATGLAILIAAVANQCTLTVWEFQLAFSLAWFSSTTHLATLDCLREYFITHGVVHSWRVFGMVALLLLLMYSLLMSMASDDATIPVQCTFALFKEIRSYRDSGLDGYDISSAVTTGSILMWLYIARIARSYKRDEGKTGRLRRILFRLQTWRHRRALKPTQEELDYVVDEQKKEHRSLFRRRQLEKIVASKGLKRHWLVVVRASGTYSRSFLSLAPMHAFMMAFGFTQLYLNRWKTGEPVVIDSSLSFGQITPIFLLVLPILSATEVYHEVQGEPAHSKSTLEKPATRYDQAISGPSLHRHSSDTWPLTNCKSNQQIELSNLAPYGSTQSTREYDKLLPQLQRYYYLETKSIAKKQTAASSPSQHYTKDNLKTELMASYHALSSEEPTLKVTTWISLVEFVLCTAVSIALGIFIYINGSSKWIVITSYGLIDLCLVYKGSAWVAYLLDLRVKMDEADYRRLMDEAKVENRSGRVGDTQRSVDA